MIRPSLTESLRLQQIAEEDQRLKLAFFPLRPASLSKADCPQDFFAPFLLVPTYAHLGRKPETADAIERLRSVSPTDLYKLFYDDMWGMFKTREDHERMIEGRKKAGAYSYLSD